MAKIRDGFVGAALLLLIFTQILLAQRMGRGNGMMQNGRYAAVCLQLPKQALDATEKEGLVYMREEEKLARDVYSKLFQKWGMRIFGNIARSEQRHMDAVAMILKKYNIADPVKNDSMGVFTNRNIAVLYEKLVAKGQKSLIDALTVGATIEDLDIFDLDKRLALTDNKDIQCVFKNLRRGSENHLRAFLRQLQANGAQYVPQYISKKEYNAILNNTRFHPRPNGAQGRRSFSY